MNVLGGKVPFAPVLDIGEALDSDYVAHVGMTENGDHPDAAQGVRTLASPFRVNGQRPAISRAPKMGEQNADLLKQDETA